MRRRLPVLSCLLVTLALTALTSRQPPPPTIAEFAPQSVENITDAPTDQSSSAGRGAGECRGGGQGCTGEQSDGAAIPTPPPPVDVFYDLSPLKKRYKGMAEMGRTCFLPQFRGRASLAHLWRLVYNFVDKGNVLLQMTQAQTTIWNRTEMHSGVRGATASPCTASTRWKIARRQIQIMRSRLVVRTR